MKLNKLLPIVALSGIATVAAPLVSCGDNNSNSIKFNIGSQTTDETVARLSVDWEPSEDSIIINNFNATCATIKISSWTLISESGARPYEVDLTFESDLNQDLDDVVVEFDYEDKTQKISNHAKLENIHVDKWESESAIDLTIPGEIEAIKTLHFIHSETMDIVAGTKYDIKIDISEWDDILDKLPYANFMFGFGILALPELSGANVDETSEFNSVKINKTPADFTIDSTIGEFNTISISTNVYEQDIVEVSLVFTEGFSDGYFYMCEGI